LDWFRHSNPSFNNFLIYKQNESVRLIVILLKISRMETKWIIITLAAIVAALVVAYLLWQNFRDKEELSNQLNRDYKSEKSENAAIEENEI
jgi:hypothetical protein